MSNLLSGLTYDSSIKEAQDTVGSSFAIRTSDIYPAKIKLAYLEKSRGGALGLNLVADINGSEYRETIYITNKEGKQFYVGQDGVKNYLPGFLNADALALLTTGQPLASITTERKVVKIYNYDQKKEVPTEVDCLTALHDKEVLLGIIQEKSFKSVKQPNGGYVETSETRESNVIDKVFHATTGKTVNEYRAKLEKAEFKTKWLEKWKDKVKDRTAGKAPVGSGNTSPAVASMSAPQTTSSLFA